MLLQPIPYGLCQCGCGEKTTLAPKTDRAVGLIAGQPARFRRGHHRRKTPACQALPPITAVGEIPVFRERRVVAHTLVNAEDWEIVARYRWHLTTHGYVATAFPGQGQARMHRLLLGLKPNDGWHVDHINRDRLDNRRENLRVVTLAENNQNRDSLPGSRSQYRGVCWHANAGKWSARGTIDGKTYHLGAFEREEDAGDAAARFRAAHMPFSEEAGAA